MNSHHDKVFVVTFMGVLGFLTVLTVVIAIASRAMVSGDPTDEEQAIQSARLAERISPVGVVITDPAALKAVAAEEDNTQSPPEIVAGLCAGCHAAGVAGAPEQDDTGAWKTRLDAEGMDGLIQSVINGKGAMPARAGDPSLSDAQLEAAVKLMLDNAKVSY